MSKKTKSHSNKSDNHASKKRGAKPERAAKDAAAPKTPRTPKAPKERDPRLPAVGATITKTYHGKEQVVKCLVDGFEFRGEHYRTLSAVARVATGAKSINGYLHFGLIPRAAKPDAAPKGRKRAKATEPKVGGEGNAIGEPAGQREALAAAGISKRRAPKVAKDDAPKSKEGK